MSSPDTERGAQNGQGDPLISVVIVNYNGRELLDPCLASVRNQDYRTYEVIVVDNASSDGSVEFLRREYPEVRVVANSVNRGFAGGNNGGCAAARGEYIALLNTDATVGRDWLTGLLGALREQKAPVCSSRVITDGVPAAFYDMNGSINFLGYNIMRQFSDVSQVFYASAAALMFRREEAPEPFLEEYFLYHEDVYLSWRMRLRGKAPVMAPGSTVLHRGSASTDKQPGELITYYQERNRMINCLLFYERRTLFRLAPYFIVDGMTKIGASLFGRKSLRGILRGYGWLISHRAWIREQRRRVQSERSVPDAAFMSLMSASLLDAESPVATIVNRLSRAYASMAGLAYHG